MTTHKAIKKGYPQQPIQYYQTEITSEKMQEIREDAQKMLSPLIPVLEQFFEKHLGFVQQHKGMSFKNIAIANEKGEIEYDDYGIVVYLELEGHCVTSLRTSQN
jgi:hypothetical protein